MNVRRARFAAASVLATAVLVGAGIAPAIADDPPPLVWTPAAPPLTTDDGVEVIAERAVASPEHYGSVTDVDLQRVNIINGSDITRHFSLGVDTETQGVIENFAMGNPFGSFGNVSEFFTETLEPGESLDDTNSFFYEGVDEGFPVHPGRTWVVYELFYAEDDDDPETPEEPPTAVELLRMTEPGEFVPVYFDGPETAEGVPPVGRELTVHAPVSIPHDGALLMSPGITTSIEASGLPANRTLEVWLTPEFDYFYALIFGGIIPAASYQVGTVTTGADGSLSTAFTVPADVEFNANYRVLVGDAEEKYWPAGSYNRIALVPADASGNVTAEPEHTQAVIPLSGTSSVEFSFPEGTGGQWSAAISTTGPTIGEFTFAGGTPLYYHLDTTVTPSPPVTVCITYDVGNIPDPPYLYHLQAVPGWPGAYSWVNITTSRVPGKVCGVTSSFSPFVLGIPDAPPDDGSTVVPAKGVLHSDNGWDTGLNDGDYNVVMNIWWGENARIVRLLENGVVVAETTLTRNSPNAQQVSFPISGRVNGTYRYTAELENSRGVTTTGALTLKVVDANPAKPVLSHDNWDNDGNFTVTANMWWGTNATSAQFYENGMPVGPPVALTAATPKAQVATLTRTGKAKATYTYTVVFTNAAGATSSASLAVKVTK